MYTNAGSSSTDYGGNAASTLPPPPPPMPMTMQPLDDGSLGGDVSSSSSARIKLSYDDEHGMPFGGHGGNQSYSMGMSMGTSASAGATMAGTSGMGMAESETGMSENDANTTNVMEEFGWERDIGDEIRKRAEQLQRMRNESMVSGQVLDKAHQALSPNRNVSPAIQQLFTQTRVIATSSSASATRTPLGLHNHRMSSTPGGGFMQTPHSATSAASLRSAGTLAIVNAALKEEAERLRADLEQQAALLASEKQRSDQLAEEVHEVAGRGMRLQQQLETQGQELEGCRRMIGQLEGDNEQIRESMELMQLELERERQDFQQNYQVLEQVHAQALDKEEQYKAMIEERDHIIAQLKHETATLESQSQAQTQSQTPLGLGQYDYAEELRSKEAQLQDLQQQLLQATQDVQVAQGEVQQKAQEAEHYRVEAERIQQEFTQKTQEAERKALEAEHYRVEAERIQQEFTLWQGDQQLQQQQQQMASSPLAPPPLPTLSPAALQEEVEVVKREAEQEIKRLQGLLDAQEGELERLRQERSQSQVQDLLHLTSPPPLAASPEQVQQQQETGEEEAKQQQTITPTIMAGAAAAAGTTPSPLGGGLGDDEKQQLLSQIQVLEEANRELNEKVQMMEEGLKEVEEIYVEKERLRQFLDGLKEDFAKEKEIHGQELDNAAMRVEELQLEVQRVQEEHQASHAENQKISFLLMIRIFSLVRAKQQVKTPQRALFRWVMAVNEKLREELQVLKGQLQAGEGAAAGGGGVEIGAVQEELANIKAQNEILRRELAQDTGIVAAGAGVAQPAAKGWSIFPSSFGMVLVAIGLVLMEKYFALLAGDSRFCYVDTPRITV